VAAPATLYGLMQAGLPQRERERDPNKRELVLPQGFNWNIFVHGTMDNLGQGSAMGR
jgi:hypothetical protein